MNNVIVCGYWFLPTGKFEGGGLIDLGEMKGFAHAWLCFDGCLMSFDERKFIHDPQTNKIINKKSERRLWYFASKDMMDWCVVFFPFSFFFF